MNRAEESAEYWEKQPYQKRWKMWLTRILEAAKLNVKAAKAKWRQSHSKSLDNLAQSKTTSQHFRHWICVYRECELVFEELDWVSILVTRWFRSDNLFGNLYPSPLAREDDSQGSNISTLNFTDPYVSSDLRDRHLKILFIQFDRTCGFLFDSNASLKMNMLLHDTRT